VCPFRAQPNFYRPDTNNTLCHRGSFNLVNRAQAASPSSKSKSSTAGQSDGSTVLFMYAYIMHMAIYIWDHAIMIERPARAVRASLSSWFLAVSRGATTYLVAWTQRRARSRTWTHERCMPPIDLLANLLPRTTTATEIDLPAGRMATSDACMATVGKS